MEKKNGKRATTKNFSQVKLGCRGLSLLVYRGRAKQFEPGAASRCVDELVRSVLSAREEREKGKEAKEGKGKGKGIGGAKAAENDDGAEAAAEAAAETAAEAEAEGEAAQEEGEKAEAEEKAAFAPLAFVRRVVPVDAAVVEGAGVGGEQSGLSVLERLANATRALVSGLDLRTLVEGRDGDEEKGALLSARGIKFAVCYRRHVPSEHEEEQGRGGTEGSGGGAAAAAAASAAAAATAAAAAPSPGLACRAAVVRTVAEALATSLKAALSAEATAPSVDLGSPDVVCCVEVLPLSSSAAAGGDGGGGPALAATLALLPRRSCDGQLRVRGVSEEDCKQSRRGQQKRR